ncbi:AAA family ATPase [Nostoc punctiforme FACHB-252]|uniref:AAA family ATPase n=1 Tax=Nostoc punctiforme FACHB-252 TaxID=1357509 RepID=A0ABR8H4K8_NOSPU|nr:ATP-binding protein [Nostoc punctiforme]MBD2610201.1 AAA family ATPase [Nostoc punctiforme FACHB-252]
MSNTQQLALSIQPIISYPRQAQVGKTYLMTIDLQSSSDEWPYEEEEYPIYCILDTSQLFSCQPLGEPAVVLHRFGGSYGAAEFLLTAAQEKMQGEITVTLANAWGMPIRVLSLGKISVTQVVTPHPVTIGSYERITSEPQKLDRNSDIRFRRNPYIFGRPIIEPKMLFGREHIFKNIQESLQQNAKFILLHGQRRIGKSSILINIPFFITQDEFIFVACDLQAYSNSTVNEILYAIAHQIVEQLELENNILNSLLNADLEKIHNIFRFRFLPLIYGVLGNKKLVLLLDEFDIVAVNDTEQHVQFLNLLENIVRQEEKLCVIAVVGRYLETMPNLLQLFRGSPVIKVGLLDELSTKQLITQPAKGILTYEPDAIQAILELSSGHPLFTQAICYNLFIQARSQDNWKLTQENVRYVLPEIIETLEAPLASIYHGLSIQEKVVFSAVAEAQEQNTFENPLNLIEDYGFVITDALEEAIQTLINKDFLDINPIKIKVELIRLWLLEHHPLRYEIWELERHDSLESPKLFVGRKSEIAAAFDQIFNRSHLAIWGGLGIGKTSFLQKLESPQAWEEHGMDSSHAVIVRFSCKKIVPFTPSSFWKKVLSFVKYNLDGELELQANIYTLLTESRTSKDSLRQILRELREKEKFLVLLVDDFDVALVQNPEYSEYDMQRFLSECRNLAVHSDEGQHMSMIVTSLKRLNELGPKLNPNASPWYNHYLFQPLRAFYNTEIDQFLQSFNKPITPELQEAIEEITGGNPTLLKIVSSLIYTELESPNQLDTQQIVNELESRTRQFLRSVWDNCYEVEQTLLILFALSGLRERLHLRLRFNLSGLGLMFSQRERELIKLEEQGILTHTVHDEKNIYSFSSSIMELWVIQELQQTDEKWLQAREKVFLNLMSRRQLDEFTTAIKWLWKNKNQIPSNLWFGKLVTTIQPRIER